MNLPKPNILEQVLPLTLLKMILYYASMPLYTYPRSRDFVQHCGVGRVKAAHFLSSLRQAEGAAREKACKRMRLSGSIEADATSLGVFHVKPSSVAFATEVADLMAKTPNMPKSICSHLRMIGLAERAGHICIAFQPPKADLLGSIFWVQCCFLLSKVLQL